MYKKGDVQITSPQCEDAKKDNEYDYWCDCGKHHSVSDTRPMQFGGDSIDVKHPCVHLDHSCECWVIGGIEEVENMLIDLGQMLIELQKIKEKTNEK